jgi:hypothetical protein
MGFDHEGPDGANFRDSSCVPQPVRWEDGEEVRRWLRALREVVKDLRAAGRDRVCRKRKRVLSRHEAGRQLDDAWGRTERLLQAGEAGLGRLVPHEAEPPPEGGAGDEPPFSSNRPTPSPEEAS